MSDLTSTGPLAVVDVADDVAEVEVDVVEDAELAADVSVTVLVSVLVVAVSEDCPQAAEVRARAITAAPTTHLFLLMFARYQPGCSTGRALYRKRTAADLMS